MDYAVTHIAKHVSAKSHKSVIAYDVDNLPDLFSTISNIPTAICRQQCIYVLLAIYQQDSCINVILCCRQYDSIA